MDWLTGGKAGEAKRLINQLANPTTRERARQELLQLGREAAPFLIEALGAPDAGLRDSTAGILAQMGPQALPPLLTALASAHPLVRGEIADILGKTHEKQAIPGLQAALQGEFYTVRAKAALALGRINDARAIPDLIDKLKDPEPLVRASCAGGLGMFSDGRIFDPIGDLLLDDPQIEVRQAAAAALGETRQPQAIPYLMSALRDSYWWYERDQGVIPLLEAIAKMGRAVVPELIQALDDPEGTVRRYAAQLLSRLPDERALDALTTTLYDTHFDVSRASAEALAVLGSPAVPVLVEALRHPEALIRQQAVAALVKTHDSRVVPELLNLLNDENREVRLEVVHALGESGDVRARLPLQELAGSRADREMAAQARHALELLRGQ